MIDKSSIGSRIQRAKEINAEAVKLTDKKKIKKDLVACLNQLCSLKGYNGASIEYSFPKPDPNESLAKFRRKMKKENGELFFIEFSSKGHIVVAGAGYDFGFPENDKYLNWRILKSLDQKWDKEIIFILVNGIRPVGRYGKGAGIDGCDHILQCRNGVEMYIGECLLKQGVPILNEHQHKNYESKFYAKELNQALLCKHLKT